jgi:hypothetical protein
MQASQLIRPRAGISSIVQSRRFSPGCQTGYSKRSFENGTKAIERLIGVKSLDKAIDVQSKYGKVIYENCTCVYRKPYPH